MARGRTRASADERDQRRLARLVNSAVEQGGLLTLAELSQFVVDSAYAVSQRKLQGCIGYLAQYAGEVL